MDQDSWDQDLPALVVVHPVLAEWDPGWALVVLEWALAVPEWVLVVPEWVPEWVPVALGWVRNDLVDLEDHVETALEVHLVLDRILVCKDLVVVLLLAVLPVWVQGVVPWVLLVDPVPARVDSTHPIDHLDKVSQFLISLAQELV